MILKEFVISITDSFRKEFSAMRTEFKRELQRVVTGKRMRTVVTSDDEFEMTVPDSKQLKLMECPSGEGTIFSLFIKTTYNTYVQKNKPIYR